MSNTVLVTGGAGYIGSHVALALLDAGAKVVVLDDLSGGFDWLVPPKATFIKGDAGDEELVGKILHDQRVDAVMHFSGSIVVPESVTDPLAYYRNNTAVSRTLIEACVANGVRRFVFSSTAAVYGNPAAIPVGEDAPTSPLSPYGRSKLMTEWMLRDVAAVYPFKYAALRYFNVAGADPRGRAGQATPAATHLIKIACEVVTGRRPGMQIFGDDYATPDGTCIRDYIHVTDLADAHLAAVRYLEGGGDSVVLNCGYGRGYSVREVLAVVEKICGATLNATVVGRRPGDVDRLVADNKKMLELFDWTPQHDRIEDIVETALAWERGID